MEERFFCLKYSLAVLIEHAFSNIHTVGNVFAIGGEIVLELKSLARESAEIHEVFDICMAPVLEDAHSPGFTGVGCSPPPPPVREGARAIQDSWKTRSWDTRI